MRKPMSDSRKIRALVASKCSEALKNIKEAERDTFARRCGFLSAKDLECWIRGSSKAAWRLVALSRRALIKRGYWGARDDKACRC